MRLAQAFRVRGIVQGVGFRPFVFRIARDHGVTGYVLNDADGVRIHAEGDESSLAAFARDLLALAPRASDIGSIDVSSADALPFTTFTIRPSDETRQTNTGISPDLPVCDACLGEMLNASDRRAGYPYINCSACGPRFSIIESLPYDRSSTTMRHWPMCEACSAEYHDVSDRRFHAQPVACHECGPQYVLRDKDAVIATGREAIRKAAACLRLGQVAALKGIGGYHLACDASNASSVASLRERKFRKEQPFAVMVRDIEVARATVELSPEAELLISSPARPIVLAPAIAQLTGVAPQSHEVGAVLPYAPIHHLLFLDDAPERLVMTSGNRSSEPIAHDDAEALERLNGIADVFLVGERPIARRVDDSVARIGASGVCVVRRSRGYSPGSVARIEFDRPVLAVGADLKNTVTLVVGGEAIMSQHIGDLAHLGAVEAFRETIEDLLSMYRVDRRKLVVVHDLHPQYVSTACAIELECGSRVAIQHHRAHVASVIAERGAFEKCVVAAAFDGTGFGDDHTIWGGEFFVGSVVDGFDRAAHLRPFRLPGGDAAATHPVQAAAGVLAEIDASDPGDLMDRTFRFPERYAQARRLLDRDVRSFTSTSAGRLFDTVAALLGFIRESTYEGQAAMWLETLARNGDSSIEMEMPFASGVLDFRPALASVISLRRESRNASDIARAFHRALAQGIATTLATLAGVHSTDVAVLSGGVFQNDLLLSDVLEFLEPSGLSVWTNNTVPPNDGGISLGQAALTLSTR